MRLNLPRKTLERGLLKSGYKLIIGVDEVGVGSLAGPVVACAAVFNKNFFRDRNNGSIIVKDSKKLSPRQREKTAAQLLNDKNVRFKISYSYPKTIDKLNIYQAARRAMARSIKALAGSRKKVLILVDGKTKIQGIDFDQFPIVKGDNKVFSIAGASIIAKVFRDKMMVRYAKRYPCYGFDKHKGYGTKQHISKLASYGFCEIHRKSFAPVKNLI